MHVLSVYKYYFLGLNWSTLIKMTMFSVIHWLIGRRYDWRDAAGARAQRCFCARWPDSCGVRQSVDVRQPGVSSLQRSPTAGGWTVSCVTRVLHWQQRRNRVVLLWWSVRTCLDPWVSSSKNIFMNHAAIHAVTQSQLGYFFRALTSNLLTNTFLKK